VATSNTGLTPLGNKKSSQKRSSSRGDQFRLYEVVESFLKTTPGGTEPVAHHDFFGQIGIERALSWGRMRP
jgi:hypothetical protein